MKTSSVAAANLMSTDVRSVGPNSTLDQAVSIMIAHHIGSLPIVDPQGLCLGIVTASDVVRASRETSDADDRDETERMVYFDPDIQRFEAADFCFPAEAAGARRVEEFASDAVIFVLPTTPVSEVAQTMLGQGIHHVLVLDEERRLQGVISSLDLVRLIAES